MENFDPKALRQVYGQFPTGVTVVTTRSAKGEPIGMTVSLDIFKQCEYFAVNILSDRQIALSNRFAGRGEDKFSDVNYDSGLGDCPLLPQVLAQLQCKNWAVYEGGDHLIMVGEVLDYHFRENARPLVFSQGTYAQANQHVETVTQNTSEVNNRQDFLNKHLPYLLRAAYNQVSRTLYERLNAAAGVSPEQWRAYACLSDGKAMALETLAKYVMQPQYVLRDTLATMGADHVQFDADSAKLTNEGVRLAQQLLTIAAQHEDELATRLDSINLTAIKQNLRQLC